MRFVNETCVRDAGLLVAGGDPHGSTARAPWAPPQAHHTTRADVRGHVGAHRCELRRVESGLASED